MYLSLMLWWTFDDESLVFDASLLFGKIARVQQSVSAYRLVPRTDARFRT